MDEAATFVASLYLDRVKVIMLHVFSIHCMKTECISCVHSKNVK